MTLPGTTLTDRARTLGRLVLPRRATLEVAWLDVAARLAGYCNALADTGDLEHRPGGYTHWRCDRRRRHRGRHRGINYTWTDEAGSCHYDPVDHDEQRAAALAADTVDADPLPGRGNDLRLDAGTYAQRLRRFGWQWRTEAARGWGPPTPGQVAALLRRPGAAVTALAQCRRLVRDLEQRLDRGELVEVGDAGDMLRHVRRVADEALERAGVHR